MGGLGWGILGAGGIARVFARDLALAGLKLAAVGSRSAEGARAFGEELGIGRRHAGYEALCADPEVGVVYVATPHPMHYEHALLALRAGKHVLVEKPFTLNAAEARALVAEARSRGLFLMEAMWTRFLPHMAALRELLDSGALGEVRSVAADHCQLIPESRAPRLHLPELGGGSLLDLGVYPLSFAHMLLGAPERVAAAGVLSGRGVDERVAASLSWKGGAAASLHCDMLAPGPNRAAVSCSRGRVEIESVWYCQADYVAYREDGSLLARFSGRAPGRGMQLQALELERLAAAGAVESPIMSHAASVEVMELMDEIRAQVGVRYPGE